MSIRTSEIYVTPLTARRLRWVADVINSKNDNDPPIGPDSLADQVLNTWIDQEHPQVLEVEKTWQEGINKLRSECDQLMKAKA